MSALRNDFAVHLDGELFPGEIQLVKKLRQGQLGIEKARLAVDGDFQHFGLKSSNIRGRKLTMRV